KSTLLPMPGEVEAGNHVATVRLEGPRPRLRDDRSTCRSAVAGTSAPGNHPMVERFCDRALPRSADDRVTRLEEPDSRCQTPRCGPFPRQDVTWEHHVAGDTSVL